MVGVYKENKQACKTVGCCLLLVLVTWAPPQWSLKIPFLLNVKRNYPEYPESVICEGCVDWFLWFTKSIIQISDIQLRNPKWGWGVKLFGLSCTDWTSQPPDLPVFKLYRHLKNRSYTVLCLNTSKRGQVYTEKKIFWIKYSGFASIINFNGNLILVEVDQALN